MTNQRQKPEAEAAAEDVQGTSMTALEGVIASVEDGDELEIVFVDGYRGVYVLDDQPVVFSDGFVARRISNSAGMSSPKSTVILWRHVVRLDIIPGS